MGNEIAFVCNRNQVDFAAMAIIYGDGYEPEQALNDLKGVLQENADLIYNSLKPNSVSKMIQDTGDDFIAGVNWDSIRTDILSNLGEQFMSNVIASLHFSFLLIFSIN